MAPTPAGTIKSGGKTRRAAKMVILDVDHPDIEEFVWCKAVEERKARVLRDHGFDMDLDGRDSFSVQYQNANNSVRVTDEFMQAVVADADWSLNAVTTGEALRTVPARDLWRQIAEAAWECADPGLQFDTTINRWHTASSTGRIEASNPCFTADTLVHTDKGLIRFSELFDRANHGEEFGVYTHDITNADTPVARAVLTTPEAFMITGRNPIVRLRFSNGMELRCTPGHQIFTLNRGYVEATELTDDDRVRSLDVPTPAVNADWALPVSNDPAAYWTKGDKGKDAELRFPELWSYELAHYIGWLIGDWQHERRVDRHDLRLGRGPRRDRADARGAGALDQPRPPDQDQRPRERHVPAPSRSAPVQALRRGARREVGHRRAQGGAVVDRAGAPGDCRSVPARPLRRRRGARSRTRRRAPTSG